jgi:hypothetical protein
MRLTEKMLTQEASLSRASRDRLNRQIENRVFYTVILLQSASLVPFLILALITVE